MALKRKMKLVLALVVFWCGSSSIHGHGGHHSHFRSASDGHDHHHHARSLLSAQSPKKGVCGTPTLGGGVDKALGFRKLKSNSKLKSDRLQGEVGIQAVSPSIIPVCITVVGDRKISKAQLNKEFAALNKAFSSKSCCNPKLSWCKGSSKCSSPATKIQFVMARVLGGVISGTTKKPSNVFSCVQRYAKVNDMSYDSDGEMEVKYNKRMGKANVLNIYYAPLYDSEDIYGYTRDPMNVLDFLALDGVVIDRDVLVGKSAYSERNEGDTLVHQVGHWFGLSHTFDYLGDCNGKGDGIADTPAEAEPNFGCDPSLNTDTCPLLTGLDPIHNFMDFSDDACLYQWTQEQVDAMHASYEFFRTNKVPDIVKLQDGITSAKYTLGKGGYRQFFYNVTSESKVVCRLSANNGDVDLYMNNDGTFYQFTCVSTSLTSQESCIVDSEWPLYVTAYAWSATTDFTVRCSTMEENPSIIDISYGGAVTGINYAADVLQVYRLPAPANPLEGLGSVGCNTTGSGTADVDLMLSSFGGFAYLDCISATPGSANEYCLDYFAISELYVGLFFAVTSPDAVTLLCNRNVFPAIQLTDGVPSALTTVEPFSSLVFYLQVANLAGVQCVTSAVGGDLALSVAWGNPINWGCYSDKAGTGNENCTITMPGAGYAFAQVYNYAASDPVNFTITCTSLTVNVTTVVDGVKSSPVDLDKGDIDYFSITVPNLSYVACYTQGSTGDILLLLTWADDTTTGCYSDKYGSNEACIIGPKSGIALATIFATVDTKAFTVKCEILEVS